MVRSPVAVLRCFMIRDGVHGPNPSSNSTFPLTANEKVRGKTDLFFSSVGSTIFPSDFVYSHHIWEEWGHEHSISTGVGIHCADGFPRWRLCDRKHDRFVRCNIVSGRRRDDRHAKIRRKYVRWSIVQCIEIRCRNVRKLEQ